MTSVDLKLNYLAATRQEPLTCLGKLIKSGRTLSYAEAEVRTPKAGWWPTAPRR